VAVREAPCYWKVQIMPDPGFRNWHMAIDEYQIAWLIFDRFESSTNVLSKEVLNELDHAIEYLENNLPKALILKSAKPDGFCAGADIEEFASIRNQEQALEHITHTQKIFDRLERLKCPSLCMIHGFCLGGGLELALACHYRIAEDIQTTRIGLPEVRLGIHPAYAGSVRLTRLIGAPAAMHMILSGRTIGAGQAKSYGIITHALPTRLLESTAVEFIRRPPRRPRARGWAAWTNNGLIRPVLSRTLRSRLMQGIRQEHYPAPYAQLDVWTRYAGNSKKMKLEEARSVASLILHPTAQNLIRLFFLKRRLKAFGKESDFSPDHVHIIGAGMMGGDIAAWCACKGIKVTIQDRNSKLIGPAIQRAHQFFIQKLGDQRLIQQAHDRLVPDVSGYGIAKADLIIEAIAEDLQDKQELFISIENQAKASAILATNTSSIRIEAIAECLDDPTRLLGIHFFNPLAQMQLVEIVRGEQTGSQYVDDAAAFAIRIDKLPLPVKSSPGFLVNRILMPYLLEALIMLEEGISGPIIDQAARNFGMPMGPVELADTVGLDVCLSVTRMLSAGLGREVPAMLEHLVDHPDILR
jgi:3-hydroxyacyl-CoA dehydrogenase/enoyl-CoA hydratase/3-hydroxybutyryl-CoA epimerase